MKNILSLLIFIGTTAAASAQTFIDKAVVEYEVKSNIKKTIGNDTWAEMMKDKLPTFKTSYYNLTFAGDRSIYNFARWEAGTTLPEYMRRGDEDNIYFTDFTTGRIAVQKNVVGSNLIIKDSLPALEWQLVNETRIIAGFSCKKAVTKIFDSVYVFAFYTEEILVPGGPGQISGLPGLIMGVTIPRLFTSWIATKVSVNGVDAAKIKAPDSKKPYTNASVKALVYENTKDWWGSGNVTDEQKQQKARFIWTALL